MSEKSFERAQHHPQTIQYKSVVIPYALWAHPHKSPHMEEGWVLPGGSRTQDRRYAMAVAERMDMVVRKA